MTGRRFAGLIFYLWGLLVKFFQTALLLAFLATPCAVQAGVVVGGTRLVYEGGSREASLSVNNPDDMPYLIQTWIEANGSGAEKAPFIVTPPLFRLNRDEENVIRVVRAGGSLPTDKESLFFMNIKSIPSSDKQSDKNTLLIAVKTRIKLIYRPEGVKGVPEEVAEKIIWNQSGDKLNVFNPTPFYMNFHEVKVGGNIVKSATYVAPESAASFELPSGGARIQWKIITDYGGLSKEYSKAL